LAKDRAAESSILIVTPPLRLTLASGSMLSGPQVVVFDEAHEIVDIFASCSVPRSTRRDFARWPE